jgi:hypothetical protein
MSRYVFRAKLVFRGAHVTVEADSLEQAQEKAEVGDWQESSTDCAELADFEITSAGELDE